VLELGEGVTGLWVTGLGVDGTVVWRGCGAEAEAGAETGAEAEGLDADAGVALAANGSVDCLAEALLPPPPVAVRGCAADGVLLVFTGGENFISLLGNPRFGPPCANEPTQSTRARMGRSRRGSACTHGVCSSQPPIERLKTNGCELARRDHVAL
jgi:hypothetical protein